MNLLCFLTLAILIALTGASATNNGDRNRQHANIMHTKYISDAEYSSEALVKMLARGHHFGPLDGVPADFECSWRKAAYEYATTKLLSSMTDKQRNDVFDSLELKALCDANREEMLRHTREAVSSEFHRKKFMHAHDDKKSNILLVSTVAELLQALDIIADRSKNISNRAHKSPVVSRIQIAPGVYRLRSPMILGPEHSNTVIEAPFGSVTITGNRLVNVTWSEYKTNRGIAVSAAMVPADLGVIDSLRVNGYRATRARYPNADPVRDVFPTGWVTGKSGSIPPNFAFNTQVVNVELPHVYPGGGASDPYGPHGFAGDYRIGVGGMCSKLTPPESYWCQPDGRVANKTFFYRTPAGIRNATAHLPNAPYADGGVDATVFYWRPGHWFTIMYELAGPMNTSGDLLFGKGGFQGAEGHDTVAEWYIENVEEELDFPNEFYHDAANNRLLYISNVTGQSPPSSVEVPALTELIIFNGTRTSPTVNVSISGIEFTGQRPTYMEPHGHPSGGDWGLERLGAVRLRNTENVTISDCLFDKLDGNAIFLDGYNRHATITHNEFVSLGASAIALWGYETRGYGTDGNQPRFTVVTENICHEIGIYQKQSSCFFQAVSVQSTIRNNLFYNGPRAMVNFNDNFGGGHDLGYNMLYNSCRESSDHGAFNSWDRQPYATKVLDGVTVSAQPAYSKLHHNWIVANYAANGGCYDNDDGSSWYLEEQNFCIYGGVKSNFEGHNKRATNNLHAFASVYGDRCLGGLNQINDYYADGYANNTCILANAGDNYLAISQPGQLAPCTPANLHLLTGGNTIYAPNASVTVRCGTTMTGEEWLASGADKGTVIKDSAQLSSDKIVAIGMSYLAMPENA
eukprot:m.384320 g.384320  ORF g.384320 m.384320 type:complete len:858 (+) comp20990_c0_seq2:333-2906(+)